MAIAKSAREIVYLRGPLHWAKVLGEPVPNFGRDGFEWVFDVGLNADGVKQMKSLGLQSRIKDKDDDRGEFTSLRQKSTKKDGSPAQPIKVIDAAGNKWTDDEKLGNGTIADVKFEVVDYGKGNPKGVYPRAIRILDHKPFKSEEFAPISKDDEFFGKATAFEKSYDAPEFKKDFGLAEDELDDPID